MAANVKVIPPKAMAADTLRVAAYCRVSSDSSDQLHSYAAQIRYYTDMIQNHDGWELVDVYADEGITGTRMDKREDLNRLLSDCRKGKIDKVRCRTAGRGRSTRCWSNPYPDLPATPETAWRPCGNCPGWAYPSSLKKRISTPERSPPN